MIQGNGEPPKMVNWIFRKMIMASGWTKKRRCVRHFVTPWAVAHQDPLSMGILQARILEWVAMPFSRGLPNPGIKPRSPTLQADSLPAEPQGKPKKRRKGALEMGRLDRGSYYRNS